MPFIPHKLKEDMHGLPKTEVISALVTLCITLIWKKMTEDLRLELFPC